MTFVNRKSVTSVLMLSNSARSNHKFAFHEADQLNEVKLSNKSKEIEGFKRLKGS